MFSNIFELICMKNKRDKHGPIVIYLCCDCTGQFDRPALHYTVQILYVLFSQTAMIRILNKRRHDMNVI